MNKQFSLNLILSILWASAALALVLRIYSLRFDPPPNAILFWLPYMILVSISAYISLTRHDNVPLIVTVGLALVLHSINVLRQPGDINWGKDAVHDLQIATKGLAEGHFVFGDPSLRSHAFDQSFYPGLELLTSSLNLTTKIPLPILYNYTFVVVNLLTLPFFFLLMRTIVKNPRIVNVSVLLYALSPQFNGFDSFTLHESLAIIFYPLVIAAFLSENTENFRRKGMLIVIILSTFLITITNEFTMYVLTFNAFIIVVTYLLSERLGKTRLPRALVVHKLSLLILCATLLFAWLSFIATYFLEQNISLIENIINSVSVTVTKTGGAPPPPYTSSLLESSFSYFGFGLLFIMSVVGIYSIARRLKTKVIHGVKANVLITWWFLNLGMLVIFEIIPWRSIGASPVRFRSMEFAYFGVAPFSAIGIQKITMSKSNHLMNERRWRQIAKIASLIIIVLISVPTILVGFSYYMYDNPAPKDMGHLNSVEAYFSSAWLSQYSVSKLVAGTGDGQIYVSGYAAKTFSYQAFRTSIQTHEITADTYYVNLANVDIPDGGNFRIGTNNLTWLDSRLNRVYDNGRTLILTAINQSLPP